MKSRSRYARRNPKQYADDGITLPERVHIGLKNDVYPYDTTLKHLSDVFDVVSYDGRFAMMKRGLAVGIYSNYDDVYYLEQFFGVRLVNSMKNMLEEFQNNSRLPPA